MERGAVIEVKDLDVMRSGALVIQGASFEIARGDYVGIVGPNGGGKTTLLLALLGMIPRHRGTVKIFGQDLERFSDWGKIAYVSQDAINFDSDFPLTVRELVSLGRLGPRNVGRPLRRADWGRVDEALEFMGISDLAGKRIGELSGGQKQRMFVAMALVRDPEVIILDEPVAGIDAVTQEKFYQKMSDLNQRKGITILMVSHDLTAVFCRMSKLICVNREVNVAEITPDVDSNEILRKAYGEHFHFVFHRHKCKGEFRND
ncbi:MAG: metal ABC transporter ATP-binding protein [Candidatus Methanosuratincola sp.]|jgi:zinc transport system ATP-binding protein|nr:metal ABC transporter ATP-binding protein [Candidatus Methanosuratincola sp.]